MIREMRLRRWARKNYVAMEERSLEWHPIVLDEMAARDREIGIYPAPTHSLSSQFVPLAPMPINIVHQAHDELVEPKLLKALEEIRSYNRQR